jgi:hypothetical protein
MFSARTFVIWVESVQLFKGSESEREGDLKTVGRFRTACPNDSHVLLAPSVGS